MKNKVWWIPVLVIMSLLCGCGANNVESSNETTLKEKNSTYSNPLDTDNTEDLQETKSDSRLPEENNANKIEGLPEDYTFVPEQSFDIEDDTYGRVKFISGYVGEGFSDDLRFYFANDDKVVYEFPIEGKSWGMLDNIQAVAFRDISGDKKKDIIIIYSYFFGAGPQGAIPRTMNQIYISTEDGYQIDSELETYIWEQLGFDSYTVDDVCQHISANFHNYEEVLTQYRRAEKNNYYEEYSDDYKVWERKIGNYVAREYVCNHTEDIYYSFYDVDQNGVDELLVATLSEGKPHYYDILSFDGEKPYRLFDMDFGYRVNLEVYTDGTLEIMMSNSAVEYICEYYQIAADGECQRIKSLISTGSMDNEKVTKGYSKAEGDITMNLTEDEYRNQLAVMQNADKLDAYNAHWLKINE